MDRRKYGFFGVALVASLAADQLTKIWARASLKGHAPIVIVQDYFDLHYSENPGVAFGMFRDMAFMRWVLPFIGLLAIGVIVQFLRRTRPDRVRLAAWLGFLGGGAIGNIVDRVLFARVTDFVLWKAPMEGTLCQGIAKVMSLVGSDLRYCEWPTFNVADAALVVGVIALLIDARADDVEQPATPHATPREAK